MMKRDEAQTGARAAMGTRATTFSDRSGVALILVVGLLALMMVMGVAFSVYMRTERVAAGNFKNDVKNRQLLFAALNRALAVIDESVGMDSYPSWDVTNSVGSGGNAMAITNGMAWGLLPTTVWGNGTGVNAQWEVPDGDKDVRVAWIALNCSGLLDANFAGGGGRWVGTNAGEIELLNLSDLANEVKLTDRRSYISQQDLVTIGTNSGALKTKPANFVTFSAFPTGSLVNIGGDVAQLVAQTSAIMAGFTNSGFSTVQAGILFTNLVDYVDADVVPGNLGVGTAGVTEGPFVEPVPMFNETSLSNRITFTWDPVNSNYTVAGSGQMNYECVFPFLNADNSEFSATYITTISVGSPIIPTCMTNFTLGPSSLSVTTLYPNRRYNYSFGPGIVSTIPSSVRIDASVGAVISKKGITVDVVTNPPISLSITFNIDTNSGIGVGSGVISYECDDPRLNHDVSGRWGATNATIGSMNSRATALVTRNDWQDGDLAMFVGNSRLAVVGELGNLFFGTAGQTVRLYQHGSNANINRGGVHRVLDFFTVDSPMSAVVRGKVHLGTRQREVMMAVYTNMPIDYPGAGTNRLSGLPLEDVVDSVMAMTATNIMMGKSLKLSDLETVNWASIYPGSTDLEREAFVRNAAGLFGLRQNYFIILLYVQGLKAVKGISDSTVLTGVRGVAEVWRDPQTNSVGRHPVVIRSFKILSE